MRGGGETAPLPQAQCTAPSQEELPPLQAAKSQSTAPTSQIPQIPESIVGPACIHCS